MLNQQNESLKFFREKKVRLALLLGLNRKYFVNEFLSGQAVLASSPIHPGNWAFNDSLMNVDYDPDNAADLLSESGWALPESDVEGINDNSGLQKDGQELKFQLLVPNDDLSVVLGEIAVEDWGQLGINAVLQTVEPDILKEEHLDTREFQAIMIDLINIFFITQFEMHTTERGRSKSMTLCLKRDQVIYSTYQCLQF